MKLIRVLIAGLAAAVLAGCSQLSGAVDLAPIPYSFYPPAGLDSKLSVELMTGQWYEDAVAAGIESAVTVTYTPDEGQPAILMGVYYMPESVFDAAANPNEPPIYGTLVTRSRGDGFVLSVAGPQDSIYDPETDDGKNISLLYEAIYNIESYIPR